MQIVTCSLDTAKNIFYFHGLTCDGEVKRKTLKRRELLTFFAKLDVCLIGMEACGGSHYWARELSKLGHRVRLISPACQNCLSTTCQLPPQRFHPTACLSGQWQLNPATPLPARYQFARSCRVAS